ncbi:hypothetical protein [Quadrisphaera sp. DSM 44207]|uniref:hypothetical protein n=1 Tax=Quadrisphaera sp. DSM 44207 TaxID=1881057 RepID=UPI000886E26C|nr:hypothetical protein [Quadrisphaera sp. DSM 44207]SDQ04580.1 hypothetical protein SAMN05428996_0153 [Quadrisphaera sp. DSM 44207]
MLRRPHAPARTAAAALATASTLVLGLLAPAGAAPTAPASDRSSSAPSQAAAATAVPEGLHPLVPGHNYLDAQRIDIVFAASGAPEGADWTGYARQLLTWDGPVPLGPDGQPAGPGEEVWDLTWGPFALEPLRSRKDLFNVWYVEEPPPAVEGWDRPWGAVGGAFPVDLPHRLEVTLAWNWSGSTQAAAQVPMFTPPQTPAAGADVFDGVILGMSGEAMDAARDDGVLAHELGHALFALPDKYSFDRWGYDGPPTRSYYPVCAADQAQAEEFFGDLVGTVDPFFQEWVAAYAQHGIPLGADLEAWYREQVVVDYVPDGCFGPAGTARRSSRGGIMHDTQVVFDAVERRWAEQVLDAWSGAPAPCAPAPLAAAPLAAAPR